MIGWDPWSKKRFNYFSCSEDKGGGKDIHCSAIMLSYLLIYYKISFNASQNVLPILLRCVTPYNNGLNIKDNIQLLHFLYLLFYIFLLVMRMFWLRQCNALGFYVCIKSTLWQKTNTIQYTILYPSKQYT